MLELQGEGSGMCISRPSAEAVGVHPHVSIVLKADWSRQDKTSAEIVDAVNRMDTNMVGIHNTVATWASEMSRFQSTFEEVASQVSRVASQVSQASDRLSRLEDAVFTAGTRGSENSTGFPTSRYASTQHQAHPPATHHVPANATNTIKVEEPPMHSKNDQMAIVPDDAEQAVSDEEHGAPVIPGRSKLSTNHTTGAARLLLNPAIQELVRGYMQTPKALSEHYPMLRETKRGILKLFGRGEGTDNPPGYDRNPMTDADTPGSSDTLSDAGSPGEDWGQLGGLSPPPNVDHVGNINHEGMPDFSPEVVRSLVKSYENSMNRMHPILVPAQLEKLVNQFLQNIPSSDSSTMTKPKTPAQFTSNSGPVGFIGAHASRIPDSPSNKRRRSPNNEEGYTDPPSVLEPKPGRPYRTISTAIVLLVMALGSVCQVTRKIHDCVWSESNEAESSSGISPSVRNGYPSPSGHQGSPAISNASGLPSPIDGDRNQQPRSRRSSVEGSFQGKATSGAKPRNLDVVPGLDYFAFATDILGNQCGGNTLQHVHANILASLYHGQLGRPVESHAYLCHACRALQIILTP